MHRTGTKHIVRHMQKSVIQWSVISKFTCSNLIEIPSHKCVDSSHNIISQNHLSSHELIQGENIESVCYVNIHIRFACVNVCGLKSKLGIPEFHEFLKKYCFICVSETKIDDLDIPAVLENLPENCIQPYSRIDIHWLVTKGEVLLLYFTRDL